MFPETYFIKKAFLPVIDENNVTKPVLMYMLEELYDAGIEDIYLIVGEDEQDEYKRLFEFDLSEEFESKLPGNLRRYYREIYEIGQRVHFVVQREKKGFGHAVYQAREFLKKEPTLLMLGDFIYKSNLEISCTQQTINAYNESGGKAVISVKSVPFEQAPNYGILHGGFEIEHPYIMDVDNMVEKPTVDYAKENLGVSKANGESACYATFGQYVLTDSVFQYLEEQINESEQNGTSSEIDVTKALHSLAAKGELVGVDIDGTSYDVGIPEMYYRTFAEFRN
jgi:UTP-glucose-1-phosphate uridylyltransferase